MRILIFYRNLRQGGVQRMMVNFANHMQEIGSDVTILLISQEGEFLKLVHPSVKVKTLPKSKLGYLLPLKHLLKDGQYNVLFTATPTLNTISILAGKLARVNTKIIISERSETMREFKEGGFRLYKISFLLIPVLYRFAFKIVAVSRGVAVSLKNIAMISDNKINVIYNPAYDVSNSHQLTQSVDEPWLTNKETKVIISAGRLAVQKNYSLLIKSFKLLVDKGLNLKLIIIGDGPLKQDLTKLIEDLNLESNVKLVGFQINPIAWICKADVFVLSSLWEGFGNILIDALAAGTTIVSTNCKSGPSEILEDGRYGYLVDSFNPNEMASIIEYAVNHSMPADQLQQRARYFEKSIIMKQYEALFA